MIDFNVIGQESAQVPLMIGMDCQRLLWKTAVFTAGNEKCEVGSNWEALSHESNMVFEADDVWHSTDAQPSKCNTVYWAQGNDKVGV